MWHDTQLGNSRTMGGHTKIAHLGPLNGGYKLITPHQKLVKNFAASPPCFHNFRKVCELIMTLEPKIREKYLFLIKLILDNIKDENPSKNSGDTALHNAADVGCFEICQIIIEKMDDKIMAFVVF